MLDDKCCGTCKYKYIIRKDSCYMNNMCFNDKSEHYADWIEYNDSCEEWERKRLMKYKVGDRIEIINATGGCYGANGRIGTVTNKRSTDGLCCDDDGFNVDCGKGHIWRIGFASKCELLDELTPEEAIKTLGDMCIRGCEICKLGKLYKESGYVLCAAYRREHPDKVVEALKQLKKDHEKKEIETEIVKLIRIMKEEGDSVTCIYTYEIDVTKENIDEKMDELVKQYYEENGGKIYAKFERICRVKS